MPENNTPIVLSLEDFIQQEEVSEYGTLENKYEGYRITSDEQANLYIKLLSEATAKALTIQQEAEKTRKKYNNLIDKWENEQSSSYKKAIEYYTSLLETYIKIKRDGKKGTEKFMYGKMSIRSQQPKYNYGDDKLIAEDLKNAGREDLIELKECIDKNKLKKVTSIVGNKLMLDNGSIIKSVEVEQRDNKVVIDIKDTVESLLNNKTDIAPAA